MSEKKILAVKNRQEFRKWLQENASVCKECWVEVRKGRPQDDGVFYYLDAVEEALCFGWIDSTYELIDGIRVQHFTPRKKRSPWSELNKERVRRLERLGLMDDRGRKVLPKMGVRSFRIDKDIEKALKKKRVWTRFRKFPPLYQRIRAYNIAFYKRKDPRLYRQSLEHLINMSRKGKMYGEWNDYGRLLDYDNGNDVILDTERLKLRRFKAADADWLFEYYRDPDVTLIAGNPPLKDLQESVQLLQNIYCRNEYFAICLKEGELPIGAIYLKMGDESDLVNSDDECELGYWLGKDYWGKGYMPEAVRELLRYGFEDLDMVKIWCARYEGNERSRRVMEKNGFVHLWSNDEVEVESLNEIRKGHVYCLDREDWQHGRRQEDAENNGS